MHVPVPTYLVLPRNGHAPCSKLLVEVIVRGLQLHAFHRGELLDVQNVLAVDGLGLKSTNTAVTPGRTVMPPTETAAGVGNPLVSVAGQQLQKEGRTPAPRGATRGLPLPSTAPASDEVRTRAALTSGLKGGSSMPASSLRKLRCLKRGCSFTSRAPAPRQPRRSRGSLHRSCNTKGNQ